MVITYINVDDVANHINTNVDFGHIKSLFVDAHHNLDASIVKNYFIEKTQ